MARSTRARATTRAAGARVSEEAFASELARTLGSLYRVSIVEPGGDVSATFGGFAGEAADGARVALPDSSRWLLIEVDRTLLYSVAHGIKALMAPVTATEMPAGTFTHVDRAIEELISLAEAQLGKPIAEMTRSEKRSVVRFLDDRGVFALRKSVDTVADALGVSRFTVYNYLDSIREA